MNLPWAVKWALRQGLGRKRGEVVIEVLEGPVGQIIDFALQGRAVAALAKVDEAIEHMRKIGQA